MQIYTHLCRSSNGCASQIEMLYPLNQTLQAKFTSIKVIQKINFSEAKNDVQFTTDHTHKRLPNNEFTFHKPNTENADDNYENADELSKLFKMCNLVFIYVLHFQIRNFKYDYLVYL